MTVSILLFATLKDAAQTDQITLELGENSTLEAALKIVAQKYPALEKWLPHARVALNLDYAQPSQILRDGDEIALIPPVSGGENQPYIAVVEREIGLDEVVRAVQSELGTQIGAICTFLGLVRENSTDPQGVRHDDIEWLEYEAYAPMAVRELEKIALATRERWGAAVAIVHRVGRLELGEASVAIAVATPHRAASFEACRFVIEELKVRVPIWKKEVATSGKWWREGG